MARRVGKGEANIGIFLTSGSKRATLGMAIGGQYESGVRR
jgi:hypothetical protein